MGMKVTIRIVGRKTGSEKWLEDACSMYQTRLRPANIDVDTVWHKNNDALVKGVLGDYTKGAPVVLLDPLGKTRSSEALADDFFDWIEEGGSRLIFVIGGAEGLPAELKTPPPGSKPPILLSLSSLTFTHQFARLVLIEQLYRASEIRKGTGYHK
jgi:23S rRNA (pseudouridine1915-N3)-methyltransferase